MEFSAYAMMVKFAQAVSMKCQVIMLWKWMLTREQEKETLLLCIVI
jgi:hypothetical protein